MKHIFLMAMLLFSALAFGQQTPKFVKFKVSAVHDGDTFMGKFVGDTSTARITVRPIGYDCPEVRSNIILLSQPYGRMAGDTLRKLIKGKTILLDTTALKNGKTHDQWGRRLAEAYFADSSSVSLFMVSTGYAWAVEISKRRIPKMNTIIRNAHRMARLEKRGLWAGYYDDLGKFHSPKSPWEWKEDFGL